jgi:hypothetical protein
MAWWAGLQGPRRAIGRLAGCEDDRVEQILPWVLARPGQVLGVLGDQGVRRFDLQGDDAAIVALDDQVDLVVAAARATLDSSACGEIQV